MYSEKSFEISPNHLYLHAQDYSIETLRIIILDAKIIKNLSGHLGISTSTVILIYSSARAASAEKSIIARKKQRAV